MMLQVFAVAAGIGRCRHLLMLLPPLVVLGAAAAGAGDGPDTARDRARHRQQDTAKARGPAAAPTTASATGPATGAALPATGHDRARATGHPTPAGRKVEGAANTAAETPPESELPARMRVVYAITFNDLEIGSLSVDAQVAGRNYSLAANARLSLLLGAFSWQAEMRALGTIAGAAARPQSYAFAFTSSLGAGATRLAFTGDAVITITLLPPVPVDPTVVRLHAEHLKGVVDPLTALLFVERGIGADPCARRLPVFDGKERFDLLLSAKGRMPGAMAGALCKVRYLPIAGHRITADTQFLAASDDIEVALRRVAAHAFIAVRITIPTRLGWVALSARRIEIAQPGTPQLALR
jgi:hypothetical protein